MKCVRRSVILVMAAILPLGCTLTSGTPFDMLMPGASGLVGMVQDWSALYERLDRAGEAELRSEPHARPGPQAEPVDGDDARRIEVWRQSRTAPAPTLASAPAPPVRALADQEKRELALYHKAEGETYVKEQRLVLAKESFDRSLTYYELPQTHHNLGLLYAREGDKARARQHFDRALALKPGYPAAEEARRDLEAD